MSLTQAVKIKDVKKEFINNNVKKIAHKHVVCFVLGVLFSFSGFEKNFSPFGVAFAGSVSREYTITSTLGAIVGYFLALDSVSALRYTASVLALSVIMIALKSFNEIRENAITPIVVTSVCVFVTGIAIAFSKDISLMKFLMCLSESAIGGAAALVMSKSRAVLFSKGGIYCATSGDITSVIISVTLLLISVGDINIYKVYPAHIIVVLLILTSAYYGKESGGAIVGICGGVAQCLSTGNFHLLALYSLGGLLSGAFSSFGRGLTILGFLLSGFAVSVLSFSKSEILPTAIELLLSAIIFYVTTRLYNDKLEKLLLPSVTSPIIESVKSNIITRLKKASEYSNEICLSLNSVNEALGKSDKYDVNTIPQKAKNKVCASCGLYDVCWGEGKENSKNNFNKLLDLKKEGVYLDNKTIPQNIASNCIRTEALASDFNKLYSDYKIHIRTEERVKELHTLSSEQFLNVASLLNSVCEDIGEDTRFDMDTASKARKIASDCGFEAAESCCYIDNLDKMTLEIKLKKPYDKTKLHLLGTQYNILTGRSFEIPEQEIYDEYLKLIYKEKAELKVVAAGIQFNSNGEKYCGDTYTTFQDDKGYFYAAICDGMGTGPKAAINSAFAVSLLEKLIKAGFGIDAAIKTINTSLISKSGEEGSVTLDLFVFDLYIGKAYFYKCGAADTLVKKKTKISEISFNSLPLGILKECDFQTGEGTLGSGDVVAMCSDGVREEDYYILRNEIKKFQGGSVRNFANDVSEKIRRCQPEKNDDMTVLIMAIGKNR